MSGSGSGAGEAAASVIGSTLDFIGQQDTNRYNRATAGKQMDFQHNENTRSMDFSAAQAKLAREYDLYTSNTQMQRRIADLRAAGMNPMLAYTQGGASAPQSPSPHGNTGSGASIPAQNPLRSAPQMITSALQAQNLAKMNANIDADTALKASNAALNTANLPVSSAKSLFGSKTYNTGNQFIDAIANATGDTHSAQKANWFERTGTKLGEAIYRSTHTERSEPFNYFSDRAYKQAYGRYNPQTR